MFTDRVPLQQSADNQQVEEPAGGHEGAWEESTSYMDDINYHKMANFLGVTTEDRRLTQVAEKISFLKDWAIQKSKSDDDLEHRTLIKQAQKEMGYQMQGKELITKLYDYLRLVSEKDRIDKEIDLLKPITNNEKT